MDSVLETPDISSLDVSEDEHESDSYNVIDSSLVQNDASLSSNEDFTVNKKNIKPVESDDDDHDIQDGLISSSRYLEESEFMLSKDQSQVQADIQSISSTSPSPDNHMIQIDSCNEEDEDKPINISDTETSNSIIKIVGEVEKFKSQKIEVTVLEYKQQQNKVEALGSEVMKMKGFIRAVDATKLPDGGTAVFDKIENLIKEHKKQQLKFENMSVIKGSEIQKPSISWQQLEVGFNNVLPRTQGKQALETLNLQKW
ncbi:hypothetical protein RN001_005658 [Aquatica leii]|uniref:Uncharacterized protein n=1 Tax=Aquatica leii TaxID=1421715 RepID=A0AAN7PCN5_9COLE|nr:hypothetical protein RN001_005658 [Aquatica leii]